MIATVDFKDYPDGAIVPVDAAHEYAVRGIYAFARQGMGLPPRDDRAQWDALFDGWRGAGCDIRAHIMGGHAVAYEVRAADGGVIERVAMPLSFADSLSFKTCDA